MDFLAGLLLVFNVVFYGVIIGAGIALLAGCGSAGGMLICIVIGGVLVVKLLKSAFK